MNLAFWFSAAAYLTWAVCGIPWITAAAAGALTPAGTVAGGAAFFGSGLAFTLYHRQWRATSIAGRVLLGVMTACALVLVWLTRNGLPGALLVVVAAGLPHMLQPRLVAAWIAVQTFALGALFWQMAGPAAALTAGGAYGGFQLFAVTAALLALNESRAVQALARTNAELTAARELLAENSRVAERMRIARDLHDTLGHHLTALSIQLDVASRLTSGPGAGHIEEAHAIAKLLLSDVRDTVSTLRRSSRIDLSQALRALASAPAQVAIHLDMPEHLGVEDSAQAHALLRCLQEIITNTARHASARNLWIEIHERPDGIAVHARDDGRGADDMRWGNGLRGMRERFEEYAGRMDVTSAAGRGFEVRGFMPRTQAP